MKRLKNILMSVTLSVCIVASSMPIEVLAKEAVPGQEESAAREHGLYEIVSFEELNEEVRNRSVPVGTALEDLSLPETLTVSCRPYTEKKDGEEETDRNPDDDSEDEENESGSGDESGEEGIESNPGDESEGEGSEGNPGDDAGNEGDAGIPDDDTGEEGSEENPGGDTEDEGNEGTPGDDGGEGGSEGNPGGDTEDEGNEGESGGDNAGEEGSEGTPDGDTGEEGSESNPGEDSEDGETGNESGGDAYDGGNEDHSDDTSADEAEMEQTTVEVHMREYKSRPEIAAEPEILEPDGQEADINSETDVNSDTDIGAETDADEKTSTDTSTEPDGGTEKDTNTDTDMDIDADIDKNQETESPSDQEQEEVQSAEPVVIENITWQSTPAYDGNTEGSYIFMPVLPEEYVPGEGVVLPEIAVMVGELLTPLSAKDAGTPACGTISTDTVWEGTGTLSDGELIVEPGVTLTINDRIDIMGKVTIKGGGTIERGKGAAYFRIKPGSDVTVGEITVEGNSIQSNDAMIFSDDAKILLDDGCRVQNCRRVTVGSYGDLLNNIYGGAALYVFRGEAVLNDVNFEGCSSGAGYGGTICLLQSQMTVNGGTYRNNRDAGIFAGSVIYSVLSKLYVYGGKFIDNTTSGSLYNGCIVDIAVAEGSFRNETHLYGGYFEGNKKLQGIGSGAIDYAARNAIGISESTVFELSGDVRFCGDGVEGSGTDGFFLDFVHSPRKVHVGSPIISPVYFYLNAQEGYVIAKGADNGYILTEKDMKQVRFTDVGDSGKQWYAWLDKEKNEIYLSEKKPPYGLYVYYSSNGATGKVEDSTEYASGADVTVKSADALSMEGHRFKAWNTKPDGTGTPYTPGSSFKITGDITLYAIFEEGEPVKSVNASFYSGSAGSREIISAEVGQDADSAAITAPVLKNMDGWTKVGWDEKPDGYAGNILPGASLTISEDTSYYGVYKKQVELSYDANGWLDALPSGQSGFRYANVHDEITGTPAEFVVGQDIRREGYSFLGWSLSKDADGGAGVCYGPEDTITLEDSATLYAQMVDDIAPVLGEAIYNSGYHNVGDWVVRKKNLEITVPVTEKGSGVNKIVYTFTPEGGEPVTGEALMEEAGESGHPRRSEEVWLEAGDGETSDGRADAAMAVRTSAADAKNRAADGEVGITDGEIRAKITISEDYKGTVSLKCRDNAGNESPLKLLTARGGGVIVEDNAPLIRFRHKENKNGKAVVEVTVQDDADEDDNSRVTGGIASVSWQTDQKQAQSVTDKGFAEGIVETCTFDVEVSGAGGHTIKVTAVDNAGNESSLSTTVKIAGNIVSGGTQKKTTVIKTYAPPAVKGGRAVESSAIVPLVEVRGSEEPVPVEKEPKTGDELPRVEIYATIAMISGLSYVALYFIAEPGGMTEAEKNEVVARLIAWAKRGKKLRRYVALAVIFCVLVYYHGIGKRSAYNLKNIRMTHGQNRIEASRYEARQ